MISWLALAAVSRCALTDLCPTDEQLIEAVRARDDAAVIMISNQLHEEDPDGIHLVHAERIKKVSDVVCGDELPGNEGGGPVTFNCKFTVRYWSRTAYVVARLVKQNGEWAIQDSLSVTRERR